jgi:RHS repeat-associated protein
VGHSLGTVTSAQKPDPFGAIQQESGSPFPSGFAGQQTDPETGLQYLRARYYDPSNGRFLSQDPLAGLLPNPLSQHRYVYGLDNPLTFGDPTGKCGEDQEDTGTDCLGPAPGMPGNWDTQEVPGPAGVGTGADPGLPQTVDPNADISVSDHGLRHVDPPNQADVAAAAQAAARDCIQQRGPLVGQFIAGTVSVGGALYQWNGYAATATSFKIGTLYPYSPSGRTVTFFCD